MLNIFAFSTGARNTTHFRGTWRDVWRRLLPVLGGVVLLQGCALTNPNGPLSSLDTDDDINALQTEFATETSLKEYLEQPSKKERDRIIHGRLAIVGIQYRTFVLDLAGQKAWMDTAFDVTALGVNIVTTVVGGATTKAALGAIAGGITGSKLAIDKNVFYEKTVPALVSAMNAGRKEALVPIIAGLRVDEETYPLSAALSDLNAYYLAGTFVGALALVQKTSAVAEEKAEGQIQRMILRSPGDAAYVASEAGTTLVDDLLDQAKALDDARALKLAQAPPEGTGATPPSKHSAKTLNGVSARSLICQHIALATTEKSLLAWKAALNPTTGGQ